MLFQALRSAGCICFDPERLTGCWASSAGANAMSRKRAAPQWRRVATKRIRYSAVVWTGCDGMGDGTENLRTVRTTVHLGRRARRRSARHPPTLAPNGPADPGISPAAAAARCPSLLRTISVTDIVAHEIG